MDELYAIEFTLCFDHPSTHLPTYPLALGPQPSYWHFLTVVCLLVLRLIVVVAILYASRAVVCPIDLQWMMT